VNAGKVSAAKAIKHLARSPQWGWTALAPGSKLSVAIDVGPRTQAMAPRLVHQVTQGVAPDCAPLFLTDGFREYLSALVTHSGPWMPPARLSAPVVTSYRRRRLVGGNHRVVFGPAEPSESMLDKRGWKINTAFIERRHRDVRHHVAASGRRVNTLCKHDTGLRQQLAIFHASPKVVRPHARLRLPLPELATISETGSIKRWQQRPPALAAGLTDRVWSVRAGLLSRVPPWPQSQMASGLRTGDNGAKPRRQCGSSAMLWQARRQNPPEDRLHRPTEGLQTDAEEPPRFTRTSPLHDQKQSSGGQCGGCSIHATNPTEP
jgi:IS1 family transposase